jgi:hypothetical protein
MKRIAILALISAAAFFGITRPTLAETTIPLEDLTLVSETTAEESPLAEGIQPIRYPPYQRPQMARPQMARPQMARPQMARPQMARPQMARPQMARPQFARPYGF